MTDSIRCPRCNCGHHRVLETRKIFGGIARVRQCRNCKKQFRTREVADPEVKLPPPSERKPDGLPEDLDDLSPPPTPTPSPQETPPADPSSTTTNPQPPKSPGANPFL